MTEGATHDAPATCRNCGACLAGRYCSACGQDHETASLPLGDWFARVLREFVDVDTRAVRTLRDVALRPAATTRAWIDGKRVVYVHPLRFALTTSALWFVMFSFLPNELPAAQERLLGIGQLANLLAVPVIAGVVRLAFAGAGSRFAEALALLLYVFGAVFAVRAVLVALRAATPTPEAWIAAVDQVVFLVLVVRGLWSFHRGGVVMRLLRTLLALAGIALVSTAVNLLAVAWANG